MDLHLISFLIPVVFGIIGGAVILCVMAYGFLIDIPGLDKRHAVRDMLYDRVMEAYYDREYEAKKRRRWDKINARRRRRG